MGAPSPGVPPTFDHLMLPHLDAAYNLARWLLRNEHDAQLHCFEDPQHLELVKEFLNRKSREENS